MRRLQQIDRDLSEMLAGPFLHYIAEQGLSL